MSDPRFFDPDTKRFLLIALLIHYVTWPYVQLKKLFKQGES